ncbi:MAG: hypothetical protein IIV03_04305, partial [Clostridia bacterium]|nr:hypothetical protein [Clostridia bacterium]
GLEPTTCRLQVFWNLPFSLPSFRYDYAVAASNMLTQRMRRILSQRAQTKKFLLCLKKTVAKINKSP